MTSLTNVVLVQLLSHLPSLTLCVLGVALAIARLKVHPRVSVLALIGFGVWALTSIGYPMLNIWIVQSAGSRQHSEMARVFSVMNALGLVATLVIQGCLLAAVFLDRQRPDLRSPLAPPPIGR